MEINLVEYGWTAVKVLMTSGATLAVWAIKGLSKRMNDQDHRITELEKRQAVYDARYEQWIDFGKPERRQR